MASCCQVAASGNYSVKQKEGEKRLMHCWQQAAPEARVLQAAVIQPGDLSAGGSQLIPQDCQRKKDLEEIPY